MKKVHMEPSSKNALCVNVSPIALLKMWMLMDGDFSLIPKAMTELAQTKSGTSIVIDGVEFLKEGSVINIAALPEGGGTQGKAASLIVSLTSLLSNKTAKEISTLAA